MEGFPEPPTKAGYFFGVGWISLTEAAVSIQQKEKVRIPPFGGYLKCLVWGPKKNWHEALGNEIEQMPLENGPCEKKWWIIWTNHHFSGEYVNFQAGCIEKRSARYMELFWNKNLPSKLLLKINLWSSCPCNINQVLNKKTTWKNIREKQKQLSRQEASGIGTPAH